MAYSVASTSTTYDYALTGDNTPLLNALDLYPAKGKNGADWRRKLKTNLATIYEYNGHKEFPGNQLALVNDDGEIIIARIRPKCKLAVLDRLIELSKEYPDWEFKIKEEEINDIRFIIERETEIANEQAGPIATTPLASLNSLETEYASYTAPPAKRARKEEEKEISASLEALVERAPTPGGTVLSSADTSASFTRISQTSPKLPSSQHVTPDRPIRRTASAPAPFSAEKFAITFMQKGTPTTPHELTTEITGKMP